MKRNENRKFEVYENFRQKEKRMIDEQTMKAFKTVSDLCIDAVGEDCKDDLILLGLKVGLNEDELRHNFPDLYMKEEESEAEELEDEQDDKEDEADEEDEELREK